LLKRTALVAGAQDEEKEGFTWYRVNRKGTLGSSKRAFERFNGKARHQRFPV